MVIYEVSGLFALKMRKRTKLLLVVPLLLPLITQPHIQALSSPSDTVAPFLVEKHQSIPNFDVEVLQPLRAAQKIKADEEKAAADKLAAEAAEAARQAEIQRQAWLNSTAGRVRVYGTYGNSYTWGNCTAYVASRISVPPYLGNANNWGYVLGAHSQPVVGSIAWTTAGWAGHVAVVEQVSGSLVLVSEMNFYGLGVIDSRWTSVWDWSGFIY